MDFCVCVHIFSWPMRVFDCIFELNVYLHNFRRKKLSCSQWVRTISEGINVFNTCCVFTSFSSDIKTMIPIKHDKLRNTAKVLKNKIAPTEMIFTHYVMPAG